MSQQGAAAHRVRAEPAVLVLGLPVGLEQEVADEVGDDEDREDLGPGHRRTLYTEAVRRRVVPCAVPGYARPMIGEREPGEPAAGTCLPAATRSTRRSRGGRWAPSTWLAAGDGREVAIKRLVDLRQAARFEIEARLLARLQHPRIARVLDHFQDPGGSYLVMELVRGSDLGEVIAGRGKPGPAGRAGGRICDPGL